MRVGLSNLIRRISSKNVPREALMDMDKHVGMLPDEFRMPLLMLAVEGMTIPEIAEILDIPPGTVKSRIFYGRKRLKGYFGKQEKTTMTNCEWFDSKLEAYFCDGLADEELQALSDTSGSPARTAARRVESLKDIDPLVREVLQRRLAACSDGGASPIPGREF